MKKLYLISALFAATTLQAQTTDLTKGLSIWFDKPCQLTGIGSFYNYSADRDWEERSLPIGNGSFGGNIFGSVAAERVTLNEKPLMRPTKCPDIPVSLKRNTEVFPHHFL